VLYELLTGRRAFEAASQASLIAAIMKEEPQPLTSALPSISPALDLWRKNRSGAGKRRPIFAMNWSGSHKAVARQSPRF
jgi:hypothetical protein